ncbi:hypothetical protein [Pseudoglutamicibacter cumminsii]|uniref:hypothetical protein n=1 Tax=Pseudoglutamicibacter cumminsii TaxID=156979 RepID=UPI0021A81A3B|nr:hypothetical protein [Pseudoglutamicibacter cumminsii]MCT1686294.1 hypothetical protein [Pseudoglutamicibacter cumminsii]
MSDHILTAIFAAVSALAGSGLTMWATIRTARADQAAQDAATEVDATRAAWQITTDTLTTLRERIEETERALTAEREAREEIAAKVTALTLDLARRDTLLLEARSVIDWVRRGAHPPPPIVSDAMIHYISNNPPSQ